MVKVSGSYESVVKGVSQQSAQDRRSGQHQAQRNMISDPVRGLARRHGSIMQAESILGPYTALDYSKRLTDTLRHKVAAFYVEGVEYDFNYRSEADTQAMGQSGFAWVFNKDAAQFVPIVYNAADATLATLVAGGVSAVANVGRFMYIAGNTIIPSWTPTAAYTAISNKQKLALWVRGGAYSRTFKIILTKANGTKTIVSHKTVSASYPTLLSTSDILTSNPDYQKLVNDRVNAYNSEVTKWIGTSSEAITPEAIATALKVVLDAAGVVGVTRTDGTLFIEDPQYVEVAGEDGGDGTLVHAVGNEVLAADLVSTLHWHGKIVKVRPRRSNGDDSFYLQAYAKADGTTGKTEVSWKESAGYITTPVDIFCMATVKNGTFYIASSAAGLSALIGEPVPGFKPNGVGDDLTSPLPNFYGKRIDYLGVLQDRLIIGSGAVLSMSRPGDYLNWFRQSVLTVLDTDPWEGYAIGAEDDTITSSVLYDRSLLLYGKRFQYMISGRQPITPKTASIVTVSAYEDATDAKPVASGNYVFYSMFSGLAGIEKASVHQVQPGSIQDNPESFEASQALDDYLAGRPVELVALRAPNLVVLRTDAARNTLYTYGYLDTASASERLFDSWSDWDWDPAVGDITGISTHNGAFLVYVLRHGLDRNGAAKTWIACERFLRDSGLSEYPYMDSLRPLASYTTPAAAAYLSAASDRAAVTRVAFRKRSQYRFIGSTITGLPSLLADYPAELSDAMVGILSTAYVTPTNPYIRDRNGQPVLNGRVTVGSLAVSVVDTGAMAVDVTTTSGTNRVQDFTGRTLGQPANLIGRQPVVSATIKAPVGKEIREFSYTLAAKSWLPLTVTGIEWVGQSFNNVRRV